MALRISPARVATVPKARVAAIKPVLGLRSSRSVTVARPGAVRVRVRSFAAGWAPRAAPLS
jgi:hypothetical protein